MIASNTSSNRIVKVLCTLGPSSLNQRTIERLQEREVDLFRINLSHTPLDAVEKTIKQIQEYSSTPICLDTEGAQVRTGEMEADVILKDGQRLRLVSEPVRGNASCLSLTPSFVFEELKPNTLIGLDFEGVVILVLESDESGAETVILNGGKIGTNKAATVYPGVKLPPLSKEDIAAVEIGRRCGVRHFALSFADSAESVEYLRELAGPNSCIISKIESCTGVENLDAILEASDEILIDRGDLSREVPLANIPLLQKAIIRKANISNTPVHVATNLLESMLTNHKPTRAEVNDIINTVLDGANGLVLAAETAIGDHPTRTVDIVLSLIETYRRSLEGLRISDLLESDSLLLPKLHGKNTHSWSRRRSSDYVAPAMVEKLPCLEVDTYTSIEIEHIVNGVFSPLSGFMSQGDLDCVLDDYRLLSGDVWTMPVILQGNPDEFASFSPGHSVRLVEKLTGKTLTTMSIEDKYEIDLEQIAERWFGTSDPSHPGVKQFMGRGHVLLAGEIQPLGPEGLSRSPYELTPEQTRRLFDMKGWSKVVAFSTPGVPDEGHKHVLAHARDRSGADGVLVQPILELQHTGDFTDDTILESYQCLMEPGISNTMMAAFRTYPRHCGAREVVFAALCRKNFGCTHFVVANEINGVDNSEDSNHDRKELFESLGDLGITPVFFDNICFDGNKQTTVQSAAPVEHEM